MSAKYTATQVQQRFGVRLHPDETPLHVYTRYGIVFLRSLLISLVLLAPAGAVVGWVLRPLPFEQPDRWPLVPVGVYALGVLAYLFYKFIDWRNDALILTGQRLIYIEQTILLSQNQREAALSKIQNIRFVVPGLAARLLNYGNIRIETAARGNDISFGPIQHPDQVQREIMGCVQSLRAATSAELMHQTLLYRLDPQNNPPPNVPTLVREEAEAQVQSRLRMPLLPPNPHVEGNTITWHKHGYFLFLRLARALVLLGALMGIAYLLVVLETIPLFWILWAVGVLAAIGYLIVQYQLWLGDVYVATADRLHDIYRTPFGLFGESRRSAPLERIQNISYVKPGLLANLLNYGDVRIQTAGAADLTFDHVPRPDQVQSEIYRRQEIARMYQQQRERDEIADWLITYQQVRHDTVPE